MNKILVVLLVFVTPVAFAGVGGGGGGVLPSMRNFSAEAALTRELVKVVEVQNDSIAFYYKAPGTNSSQFLMVAADAIDHAYLEALSQSWQQNSWIEIEK